MITNSKNYANIPNKVIEVKKLNELNLQQQRFWVYAIQIMQRKISNYKSSKLNIDWDYVRYGEVSFKDFSEIFNIGLDNHTAFRNSIKNMINFSLMVKYSNKDEDYFPVFSRWRFGVNTNKIYWKFNDVFNELFLNLSEGYFTIAIEEILTFDSVHAITVYMLLKSKLNMEKKEHIFELEELKKLLNINKKYSLFKDFRVRVLDIAKKYIDASPASSFSFKYEVIKIGKKVNKIKFIIYDKRSNGSYYISNNIVSNYKKDVEYKRYKKMLIHENTIIANLAKNIIDFIEEYGFDINQKLLKFYINSIEKELLLL